MHLKILSYFHSFILHHQIFRHTVETHLFFTLTATAAVLRQNRLIGNMQKIRAATGALDLHLVVGPYLISSPIFEAIPNCPNASYGYSTEVQYSTSEQISGDPRSPYHCSASNRSDMHEIFHKQIETSTTLAAGLRVLQPC
jgi:hypothetical protein